MGRPTEGDAYADWTGKEEAKERIGGTDELTEVGGGCIGPAEVGDLFWFFLCFWSNKDCHCVQE